MRADARDERADAPARERPRERRGQGGAEFRVRPRVRSVVGAGGDFRTRRTRRGGRRGGGVSRVRARVRADGRGEDVLDARRGFRSRRRRRRV